MINVLFLLLGFILLIKGADYFVDSASAIARRFKIPSMIIGLVIVSIGTSLPELSVSVSSSLNGMNDLSVANVVGSNIFNILMVLGFSSLITKLPIEENSIKFDLPFLNIVSIMLLAMLINLTLGRFNGVILIGIFVYFLWHTIKPILNEDNTEKEIENKLSFKVIVLGILGVIGIILGGDMVVDSASNIAKMLGMSENLIGLTIVAIGTSLPEFVTSIIAVLKGENEIAIGNVIGSNIFNILLILGVSSVISPIVVSFISVIDVIFMIGITILLYVFVVKNKVLNRCQGIVFIFSYIGYIFYTIIR
jgi:cation:H+ antiporter